MQPVPELVKQRDDIVVCQQRGVTVRGRQEIADQVGDRSDAIAPEGHPAAAFIHPSAAALVAAAAL